MREVRADREKMQVPRLRFAALGMTASGEFSSLRSG